MNHLFEAIEACLLLPVTVVGVAVMGLVGTGLLWVIAWPIRKLTDKLTL